MAEGLVTPSLQVGAACAARLFPVIGSSAGTAVTVEFLGPLTLAAVLSRRLRALVWVLLAAGGVVLLGAADGVGGGRLDPVGIGFALVAAVLWAGYIVASARVRAAVPGQGGLGGALLIGAVVLAPLDTPGAMAATTRLELLLLAAGTGVLASVIPYSLELAALRRLPPRVFGVLLSLEPAVAATAGWLLLGQRMGTREAIAVAVAVLASAGSTLTARRSADEPATADSSPAVPAEQTPTAA